MNDKKNLNSRGMFISAAVFIVSSILWFLYAKIPLGVTYLLMSVIEFIAALKANKSEKQSK